MNKIKKIILFLVGIIVIFGGLIFFKGINTFSAISSSDSLTSLRGDDRWDILILGHQPTGGLTDSIMVLSYKKETGQAALFSIPRDLWVTIPEDSKQRINYAYVAGERKNSNGGGLELAKEVVSNVTGLDIDFAIAGDVTALKDIVDALGGIEIEEDRYFSLDFYGNYVKIKPGKNELSGSETLAYVGSRAIAPADFGRMERQQKVLVAIKDKAFSLGVLSRPDRIWNIFNSIDKHIETDIPLSQMKDLIKVLSSLEIKDIKTTVFDTSNYLYSTHSNGGAYILLPKKGNFSEIQADCQGIFEESLNQTD
jgi:LCP family protein required for cell wall assembly